MNFFQDREFLALPAVPSALQIFLRDSLRDRLNIVRAALGIPLQITGCYRDAAAVHDLIVRGYNPSKTSDHFWADPVPTTSITMLRQYGKAFIFSAGAVDMVPKGKDVLTVFQKIVEMQKSGAVEFGQVIYERAGEKEWVHVSNPRTLLFTPEALARAGAVKTVFLASIDGGQSYQPYGRDA
jgi:hypothetical protein